MLSIGVKVKDKTYICDSAKGSDRTSSEYIFLQEQDRILNLNLINIFKRILKI